MTLKTKYTTSNLKSWKEKVLAKVNEKIAELKNKKPIINKQNQYWVTKMLKNTWKNSIRNLLVSPLIMHQTILHLYEKNTFFLLLLFFSFYHCKIHPVTNYKAVKNKINKTRQHRTKFFLTIKTTATTTTTTKKTIKKKTRWNYSLPPFHFERSINQSYDR